MKLHNIICVPSEADLLDNIKYIVDQQNRTVKAILEDCSLGAIDALCRCNNGKPAIAYNDTEALELLMLPDKLVAVTKCHPDDKFDIARGKSIAKKRLCEKFDRYRTRAWNKYHTLLMKRLRATSRCIERHYHEPSCNEGDRI